MLIDSVCSSRGLLVGLSQFELEHFMPTRFAGASFIDALKSSTLMMLMYNDWWLVGEAKLRDRNGVDSSHLLSIGKTNALFVAILSCSSGVRQCRIAARRPPAAIHRLIARTAVCYIFNDSRFLKIH